MTDKKRLTERMSNILKSRMSAVILLATACAAVFILAAYNVQTVTIFDGNQSRSIATTTEDTGAVLELAGVSVSDKDYVDSRDTNTGDREITILRANEVPSSPVNTVTADAKSVTVSYYGMLAEYGSTEEADGSVEYKTVEVEKEIPFEQIERTSASLPKGTRKLETAGQNGVAATVYKQKIVGGRVVESVLEGDVVKQEPVDEVTLVGTYVYTPVTSGSTISQLDASSVALDSNGMPISYKKIITGSATAYNGPGKFTASGRPAMKGHVAVDPREIPYGTRLYIVSADGKFNYGYCIAADTGGFVYNSNTVVDLFFDTYAECAQFGRRDVIIYVL